MIGEVYLFWLLGAQNWGNIQIYSTTTTTTTTTTVTRM
jgi:hypothetical protein